MLCELFAFEIVSQWVYNANNSHMKLTAKRQSILDTIKKQKNFVSARVLSQKLSHINQATVYRNLDFFVKQGLIKKFVFEGAESLYEFAHDNHHHAVCSDCETVKHFSISDREILKKLNIKDFDVDSVELIVRGRCK